MCTDRNQIGPKQSYKDTLLLEGGAHMGSHWVVGWSVCPYQTICGVNHFRIYDVFALEFCYVWSTLHFDYPEIFFSCNSISSQLCLQHYVPLDLHVCGGGRGRKGI